MREREKDFKDVPIGLTRTINTISSCKDVTTIFRDETHEETEKDSTSRHAHVHCGSWIGWIQQFQKRKKATLSCSESAVRSEDMGVRYG